MVAKLKENCMKVGNTPDKATAAISSTRAVGESDGRGSVQAPKGSAPKTAAQSTTVNLSAAAQALSGSSSADFDDAKVAQVKSSLEQGTYKVNHQAIADKLISNAQELLGKS